MNPQPGHRPPRPLKISPRLFHQRRNPECYYNERETQRPYHPHITEQRRREFIDRGQGTNSSTRAGRRLHPYSFQRYTNTATAAANSNNNTNHCRDYNDLQRQLNSSLMARLSQLETGGDSIAEQIRQSESRMLDLMQQRFEEKMEHNVDHLDSESVVLSVHNPSEDTWHAPERHRPVCGLHSVPAPPPALSVGFTLYLHLLPPCLWASLCTCTSSRPVCGLHSVPAPPPALSVGFTLYLHLLPLCLWASLCTCTSSRPVCGLHSVPAPPPALSVGFTLYLHLLPLSVGFTLYLHLLPLCLWASLCTCTSSRPVCGLHSVPAPPPALSVGFTLYLHLLPLSVGFTLYLHLLPLCLWASLCTCTSSRPVCGLHSVPAPPPALSVGFTLYLHLLPPCLWASLCTCTSSRSVCGLHSVPAPPPALSVGFTLYLHLLPPCLWASLCTCTSSRCLWASLCTCTSSRSVCGLHSVPAPPPALSVGFTLYLHLLPPCLWASLCTCTSSRSVCGLHSVPAPPPALSVGFTLYLHLLPPCLWASLCTCTSSRCLVFHGKVVTN
ncbi:hypothetical protein ACOMHN_040017 [Nucella lapillus]